MFTKDRLLGHLRWTGIMAGIMAGIAGLLYLLLRFLPDLALHSYVPFSRFFSGLLGMAFGFIPLSAAELLIGALLLFYTIYLVVAIVRGIKKKQGWGLLRWLYDLFMFFYCTAFFFFALWGGNYLAKSLDERMGLEVRERPAAALEATTRALLSQIIETAPLVPRDASGLTFVEGGYSEMAALTTESMKALLARYPELFGNAFISAPKPILLSYPMAFTGITGIYIPLTGEANVNTYVTDAFMPAFMAHEMAHRLGCAPEDDANFLAYLACAESESPLVRYSGAMFAYGYCRGAILDAAVQQGLWDVLPANVKADYVRYYEVQNSFAGPLMEASAAINDGYIRVMGQDDGLQSYGRVVDLLIAKYVAEHGEFDIVDTEIG